MGMISRLLRSKIVRTIILLVIGYAVFQTFPITVLLVLGVLGLRDSWVIVEKEDENGDIVEEEQQQINVFGKVFLIYIGSIFMLALMAYDRFSKRNIQFKPIIKFGLGSIIVLILVSFLSNGFSFAGASSTILLFATTGSFVYIFLPVYYLFFFLKNKYFPNYKLDVKNLEFDDLKDPNKFKTKMKKTEEEQEDGDFDPEQGDF